MKPSLSFFPHSTNTFFERNIRKLLASHQANGYLLYHYFKTEIFKVNGYYLDYDELFQEDICDWFKFLNKELVNNILDSLLEIGLFNRQIFTDQKILTSASIQEDFVEIMKRMKRQYFIKPEIRLLETSYYESALIIKDEAINKSSKDFGKLPQPKNNSSEKLGSIKHSSEEFGGSEHSSEEFNSTSECSMKNVEDSLERKEAKEIKRNKINNISLSLDKEKLLEVFLIEKNFPANECEKFCNHYSKTGWKDKNGNQIEDPYAAARNWTQLIFPHNNYINPEYHQYWKKFWLSYKGKVGFDNAKYLLNIKPEINGNTIVFICKENDSKTCEDNYKDLVPLINNVFGKEMRFRCRLVQQTGQRVV